MLYPPSNSFDTSTFRSSFLFQGLFALRHILRTGQPVSVRPTHGGMILTQGGTSVPPPIRFTPRELEAMAHEYFLWGCSKLDGKTVVDVGAGMGTEIPTFASLVGDTGSVIAFEAHPKSWSIAERVLEINQLQNVTLLNYAIWSSAGEVELSDSATSLGVNSLIDQRLLSGRTVRVRAITLDDWFLDSGLSRIGLLKMNIEGAEVEALQGAGELLSVTDRVVVSCHDFVSRLEGGGNEMNSKNQVLEILCDAGFRVEERPQHRNPAIRDTLYGSKS